jgi:hypothetical protein
MAWVDLLLAMSTASAAVIASYPWLYARGAARIAVTVVAGIIVVLSPLIVPPEFRLARLFSAIVGVMLLAKLFDIQVHVRKHGPPRFGAFLAFLPNIHSVVLRRLADEPAVLRRRSLRQLGQAAIAVAIGVCALASAFRAHWSSLPFFVEHSVKVLALFLVIIPGAAAMGSLWRLCGGTAREFMDRPYLAATPADFWRRYNRPAGQFFYEDVFKLAGGRRRLLPAVILAFAVSAALHEYLFDIAVGRVQGYQTAFFALQGAAVAATLRLRPRGKLMIPCTLLTLLFNLVTSVLFFMSLDEVLPFYQ